MTKKCVTFNELSAAAAIKALRDIGNEHDAQLIENNNQNTDLNAITWPWNKKPKPWEYSSYAYGFISSESLANSTSSTTIDIKDARNINPADDLKNSSIIISLDYVRIFDFPGSGNHQVLMKFTSKNQLTSAGDEASFNQIFNIQEKQHAPVSGYPIFVGLNLKTDPLIVECEIVNVKNDNDEKLLSFIDSNTFKDGMKLLNQVNPAMPIISSYATGITKMIAGRNKNITIPAPKLGMYFSNIPTQIKLSKGSYVSVQVADPGSFDWSKWVFDKNSGTIREKEGTKQDIPFNYFVFSVNKYS